MPAVHLHRDDAPQTLAVLDALLGHRSELPAGYTPDQRVLTLTGTCSPIATFRPPSGPSCTSLTAAPSWNATAAGYPSNLVRRSGQQSRPSRSDAAPGE